MLRPKQLVFALGASGYPTVPEIPGAGSFEGEQHHSSRHPGGEAYRGKRVVVLGSNNSAHDICADLWEHGADVTMIQRSSTLVARSETLYPGEFFGSGTVGNGCGLEHMRFLKPGDVVELEVEKIGILRNRVVKQ